MAFGKINISTNKGVIKSVQRGEFMLGVGEIEKVITINEVDKFSCLAFVEKHAARLPDNDAVSIELISGTEVKFVRNKGQYDSTFPIHWSVYEFNGVKSRQEGFANIGNPEVDILVNLIDINKSLLYASMYSTQATSQNGIFHKPVYWIKDNKTISLQSSNGGKCYWQLLEFK